MVGVHITTMSKKIGPEVLESPNNAKRLQFSDSVVSLVLLQSMMA